jgi:integrase
VEYLEYEEIEAILSAIDQKTLDERRDYALLTTMFNTAARVQEIADLRARNLQLTRPFQCGSSAKDGRNAFVRYGLKRLRPCGPWWYGRGVQGPRTRGSIALWVATVWLYVDNNAEAQATWRNWVPLLRYMMPAEVLYHEIGHHIHAVHRPIHDGRETFAEDWSRKLWGRFCRKHYWYLFPFLYVFALLASPIVKRYLTFAIRKTHSLPKFRPAR